MKQIESTEQYFSILSAQKKNGRRFTNDTLLRDKVERLVDLKRLYYKECGAGVTFFTDQESHYQAFVYVEARECYRIDKMDKPVVIRFIYKKDRKKDDLLFFEKQLEANDFSYEGASVPIQLNVEENRERCVALLRKGNKYLASMGLQIQTASYELYGDIQSLLQEEEMLQDHFFEYRTEEEVRQRFESGGYICVVDQEERVIAYNSAYELNDGWFADAVVVKDAYRMYGLAPLLTAYRIAHCSKKIVKGMIFLSNEASMKMCRHFGWKFSDKYTDNWYLGAK